MLVIREDQLAAFEADDFKHWMEQHLRTCFPRVCGDAPAFELHAFTAEITRSAQAYGFRQQSEIARFADLAVVLGFGFDQDPSMPWARQILTSDAPPTERLLALSRRAKLEIWGDDASTTGGSP
jgi:hypothetical protein